MRDFTTSLQRAAPVETLYDLRRLASSTVEPLEDDFGEKSLHFRLILEMLWRFSKYLPGLPKVSRHRRRRGRRCQLVHGSVAKAWTAICDAEEAAKSEPRKVIFV